MDTAVQCLSEEEQLCCSGGGEGEDTAGVGVQMYRNIIRVMQENVRHGDVTLCLAVVEKRMRLGDTTCKALLADYQTLPPTEGTCCTMGRGDPHWVLFPDYVYQALLIYHSFYTRESFRLLDRFIVASVCLLVALKAHRMLPFEAPDDPQQGQGAHVRTRAVASLDVVYEHLVTLLPFPSAAVQLQLWL